MAGVFAHGTTLTIGSAIAELTSIGGIGGSGETLDVTTHDSEDKFREFVGGLRDGGEISIAGYFTSAAEANTLYALLGSGAVTSSAVISFPTTPASTFTFECIVTGYTVEAPFDGVLRFSGTLKVSGKPVFA